jgi:hypothetical protein
LGFRARARSVVSKTCLIAATSFDALDEYTLATR